MITATCKIFFSEMPIGCNTHPLAISRPLFLFISPYSNRCSVEPLLSEAASAYTELNHVEMSKEELLKEENKAKY